MTFKQLVNEMKLNPSRLFLIDSLGAVVSAFFLGVILVKLENFFGMPRNELFYLAIAPCFFAVYSFLCYLLKPTNWRFFLKIIAFANLFYCCVSMYLVFYHFQQLTIFGLIYFFGELMILIVLIQLEFQTASKREDINYS